VFPLLHHHVVVVFIIALLNIALLKVNMRISDIKLQFIKILVSTFLIIMLKKISVELKSAIEVKIIASYLKGFSK